MSPLLCLTTVLALTLVACAEGSYGGGYGYAHSAAPRRRIIVKTVRTPYVRKPATTVYRSPLDSYDEADAFRTADSDVLHRTSYKPAVVAVKKAYVPVARPAVVKVVPTVHKVHPVAHVPAYHYDYHVTPECAIVGKQLYNLTVCLDDAHYPTEAVLHELKTNPELTARLMSDVTYQSADNLVDGLTKAEEEKYTQQHYYGTSDHADHHSHAGHTYAPDYRREGGYICPSDIFYGRVKRAVNTYGEWKVVVNMPDELVHDPAYKKFVQTSRLENCVHRGTSCSFVEHVPSKCLQKHSFVRLVTYDPKHGLHTDSFKLPSACSCHLSPRPYY